MHPEPVGPLDAGDDAEMELLLTRSTRALARAGITAEDFLRRCPRSVPRSAAKIYGEGYLRVDLGRDRVHPPPLEPEPLEEGAHLDLAAPEPGGRIDRRAGHHDISAAGG